MGKALITLAPGSDCAPLFYEALRILGESDGPKVLQLAPGKYVFRKENAAEVYFPVSNTILRSEPQIKHVGIFASRIDDLAIEGNGAELLFDGDMSAIILDHCNRVRLEDITVNYLHPRVSEMRVLQCDETSALFSIHPSSRWTTDEDGRFCWLNADGMPETTQRPQVVQVASPGNASNLRTIFNPIRQAASFEILSDDSVRFHYLEPHPLNAGETWQFRDPSRRENGIVIANCHAVALDGLQLGFTPGLGVVCQMTKDIIIRNHRHAPLPGSGRVCAALADCIQVSSCYGTVEIADSYFSGAQDDPINIHGTYLAIEKTSGNKVWLRFCQSETWGWLPFLPGDEVCPVRRKDFKRGHSYHVVDARLIDAVHVVLTLDERVCDVDAPAQFVMENMSAYPDAYIHDCVFECYPTRGILLTSAGKCRICNNEIRQTAGRPAIHISGDANSWYESGGVRDVEITGNRFRYSTYTAINIEPELNAEPEEPVHTNIRIHDNTFEECSGPYLRYHSTAGLQTDIPAAKIHKTDFSEERQ